MTDTFLVYLARHNIAVVVAIEPSWRGDIRRREHLWPGLKSRRRRKYPAELGEFAAYEAALACAKAAVAHTRWTIHLSGCPAQEGQPT
jgi:hypothetical protein